MYPEEMHPEEQMYPGGDPGEPGEQVQPTEDKLYVKLAHIGEGSYADVYLATPREPQLFGQQQFVIKELDVMSMEEKDQKKAVLEVNILSTLTHPNIIGYKESYIHDGFLCIVMEHADGGDLFHQISHARETGYFIEEKVILSWLAQILLALQYVHSNQLLHRDIKPQNIFLLGNGMVKLGDFGVSRVLERADSLASTTTGTPCYFSPELCRNDPYDAKSDIWALGCITYEMAQLVPPFPSEDMAQMCRDIIGSEATPLPAHYSHELRVIIKMMMEKRPEHRPTAEQLLAMPVLRKVCKRLPWARAQTTACVTGQRKKTRRRKSVEGEKGEKVEKGEKGKKDGSKKKSGKKKHRNRLGSAPAPNVSLAAIMEGEHEAEPVSEFEPPMSAAKRNFLAQEQAKRSAEEREEYLGGQSFQQAAEDKQSAVEDPLARGVERINLGVCTQDARPQFSADQRGLRGVSASSKGSRPSTKHSARGDKDKSKPSDNKWGCTLKIGDSSEMIRPKNAKPSDKGGEGAMLRSPNKAKLFEDDKNEEDKMRDVEQRKFEEMVSQRRNSVDTEHSQRRNSVDKFSSRPLVAVI